MTSTDVTKAANGGPTSPLARLINELGLARIAMIMAVTGGVVLGVVFLTGQLTKPPMGLLYANLDMADAANIAEQLRSENIIFEMRGNGSTILVEQDKVLDLRMRFAGDGLPATRDVGYEIFDEQGVLGQTSFQQSLNRQRALEGELSRTIRSIGKIDTARVHLVLPEREAFSRDEKVPTASIVLKTRGYLDRGTVQAIQHLVASAVPGLNPGKISVIDERGTLLASGGQSDEDAIAAASLEDRQATYEERLRQRVLEIIAKYTGTGNAQVQVSAELDFNRVTEQSTTYDPDTQVVSSSITIEETENDQDRDAADQGVTIAGNLPNAQANASSPGASSSSSRNRTEEEVKYQNSQTVRTEVREAGKVTRLSVAVLVDGFYQKADDGTRTYQPRSQTDLDQITELVKAGIGFDEARGDQLTVANLPFAQAEIPEETEPAANAPFLSLTKSDYIYLGQLGVLAIIGLVLLLFVVRPLLLGLLRTSGGAPVAGGRLNAPGAPAISGQADAGSVPALPGQALDEESLAKLAPRKDDLSTKIDIAQIEGQVKESSIRKIGEVAMNHPDESAAIVRNWLQQPE